MEVVVFPFDKLLEVIVGRGQWLLVVVVLDVLFGVLTALKQKEFKWEKFADFLSTYGLKIVGWLTLEVIALLPTEVLKLAGFTTALATSAYAALMLSAIGSVLSNVKIFLPDAVASGMNKAGL